MFAHAGTARLDFFTDSLLLEVGEDLFLASLSRLSPLMQGRAAYCPLSRRYQGTGGHYCDVEQGIGLRRSKPGAALIFVDRGTIYSIPVVELREVLHGVRSECGISRVLTTERRVAEVEA
jgi:hypothetical protein